MLVRMTTMTQATAQAQPRPPKIPESVLVVIHTPALEVLLIERADRPGFWQSVTGSKDFLEEPPHETAAREVREETGLTVSAGRLVCVDTRPAKPGRLLGLRFLFACEADDADVRGAIRLQASEIEQHRPAFGASSAPDPGQMVTDQVLDPEAAAQVALARE